jgi:hypothetical protein
MSTIAEHVLVNLIRLGQQGKRREIEGYVVDSPNQDHVVSRIHKVVVIVVRSINEWGVHPIVVETQEEPIIGHAMRNFSGPGERLQIGHAEVVVRVIVTSGIWVVKCLNFRGHDEKHVRKQPNFMNSPFPWRKGH